MNGDGPKFKDSAVTEAMHRELTAWVNRYSINEYLELNAQTVARMIMKYLQTERKRLIANKRPEDTFLQMPTFEELEGLPETKGEAP